jgi:catechol 2,3-dioxygenase-like lactoylglutathione lyase family enzyme
MTVTFTTPSSPPKTATNRRSSFVSCSSSPEAPSWGPFTNVQLDEGVLLQFAELPRVDDIQMQHYAFLVDDDLFDRAYARIQAEGIEHWADPELTRPGHTNTEHGGRGVYFKDPTGHAIEMITRPYL